VVVSIYADDTNVTVRSGRKQLDTNKLNYAIKILEPWLEKWRIKFYASKCCHIIFKTKESLPLGAASIKVISYKYCLDKLHQIPWGHSRLKIYLQRTYKPNIVQS
jgi:hypothetical protein